MKDYIEQLFKFLISNINNENLDGLFGRRRGRRRSLMSGTKDISFNLDKKGVYDVEAEPFGAGISVNYEFVVNDPNANYDITIYSSGGGGGEYKKIQVGQKVKGVLQTNKSSKTKLKIMIKADKADVVGHATIHYSV
ncbi:hypothetical protein PV797_04570 [Clostridiaceae bacterium M8S5]|nr:hypothetical protein PV797_04570 [Clostridiaceae bacterium M8S5]